MAWIHIAVALSCVILSAAIAIREESAAMFNAHVALSRYRRTTEHQDMFLSTPCEELGVSSKLTQEQKDWILDYHNEKRRESGSSDMEKMTWDEDLACQAQRVVDSCRWGHNDIRGSKGGKMLVGQNIVAEYVSKDIEFLDHAMIVRLNKFFFDEKKYYHYPDSDCFGPNECNHYRMMMIASNSKLGGACGICDKVWTKDVGRQDISKIDKNVAFCVVDYSAPLSSVSGVKLFLKGEPCSRCRFDYAKCEEKLCVKCKEGEPDCKFYGNCKDISDVDTCNFFKQTGICYKFENNCAKTCGICD